MFAFQHDRQPIQQRLSSHYRLTVDALRGDWTEWCRRNDGDCLDCDSVDCSVHAARHFAADCRCTNPSRELLVIWTASWCGPCRRFWQDWQQDEAFRRAILSRFHVHLGDFDRNQSLAAERGIATLPAFDWSGGRITGYAGKQSLLDQLLKRPPTETPPAINVPDTERADTEPHKAETGETLDTDPPASVSLSPPLPVSPSPSPWQMLLPSTLTALQWTGLIGGSVATGGLGGVALSTLLLLRRRRRSSNLPSEGRGEPPAIPFPRRLDEARQLLGLRQSEGRVAVLDALRGMFLDDELEKLTRPGDPATLTFAQRLRERIDARVEEVAPLSTRV